ncbi:MAG: NF038122 family metalloprotease [Pirellulales bacterium]
MFGRTIFAFVLYSAWLLSSGSVQAGLTFNLVDGAELQALQSSNASLYGNVRGGFDTAAARWSNLFSDNITVNIDINYKALGAGILGQAGSSDFETSYSAFKSAITADISSATDIQAVSNLPAGSSFNMLTIDRTTGSTVLDNNGSTNNTMLDITTANAKALGLLSGTDVGTDAKITFSSNFTFDFDPSNGITAGQYDFVGVATHEIGHALGFVSGVDALDFYAGNGPGVGTDLNGANAGIGDFNDFAIFTSLDMFRYSTTSKASGVLDLAYNTNSFFSLDGGTTSLGQFSTGVYNGDGRLGQSLERQLGTRHYGSDARDRRVGSCCYQ